ncbi:AlbA family DNA-binding domain-containing protein [Mongoliitalea daihaiensis]|uniref:AlbA family DNA-binding domain-containing protein n=1 Tax=Mongoliitalea daihaiensis TaxID=2782006 RepID=UPI001F2CF363|nr:ATP-binding protein [Mongoliitalea daihaiensis]UJP64265.1 ATP-binding protein [Mongoliitalea daihaiensis]
MLLPKKNSEFVESLLKRPEGLTLDFKLHITNSEKIAKTLVAFANTNGGIILIGVSDKGQIIGIDGEEETYMLDKASEEFCSPPIPLLYDLYEMEQWDGDVEMEERYVLIVKVPKTGMKHLHKNAAGRETYYIRRGDQTIPQ